MATPAHCLYCFETLAASLEHREGMSLRQVSTLWDAYKASQQAPTVEAEDEAEEDEAAVIQDAPPTDGEMATGKHIEEEIEQELSSLRANIKSANRLHVPLSSHSSSSSTPLSTSTSSSSRTPTSELGSSSSSSADFFASGGGSGNGTSGSSRHLNLPRSSASSHRHHDRELSQPKEYEESPLFVTWNTVSSRGHKTLRGCIGTFEPQELESGLRSYALTSAFDDSRFSPISPSELPSLECGITLLTTFQPCSSPTSWDLGTHGLRISFTYHNRKLGATYLPDVPVEQGWTKEETLVSLMRKAGWSGRREDWRRVGDLRVVRYQGRKEVVGYREWRDWRAWVERRRRGEEGEFDE